MDAPPRRSRGPGRGPGWSWPGSGPGYPAQGTSQGLAGVMRSRPFARSRGEGVARALHSGRKRRSTKSPTRASPRVVVQLWLAGGVGRRRRGEGEARAVGRTREGGREEEEYSGVGEGGQGRELWSRPRVRTQRRRQVSLAWCFDMVILQRVIGKGVYAIVFCSRPLVVPGQACGGAWQVYSCRSLPP